jgi:hypothetical protein
MGCITRIPTFFCKCTLLLAAGCPRLPLLLRPYIRYSFIEILVCTEIHSDPRKAH